MKTICNIVKVIVLLMLICCFMGKIDYRIVMLVGAVLCILEKKVNDDQRESLSMCEQVEENDSTCYK